MREIIITETDGEQKTIVAHIDEWDHVEDVIKAHGWDPDLIDYE